jgi:guanylate kinase
MFSKAIPLTTRTTFGKQEAENIDFKLASEDEFNTLARQDAFLFIQDIEQNIRSLDVKRRATLTNPILSMLSFGQKKDVDTDHIYYEWKRSGVLKNDVSTIMEHGKIALIECSLQDACKIHETYHEMQHECNFVFLRPPSVEELRNRLIRDVERLES